MPRAGTIKENSIRILMLDQRVPPQILCFVLISSKNVFQESDVFELFRLFSFLSAIVLHDCLYQFVRLFYHSRLAFEFHKVL